MDTRLWLMREMRKSHKAPDTISSELRRIADISQTVFGSEDDLIHKIILPFFQEIGYGPDLFELKFPVKAHRPNRRGRKPEADCVFFSSSTHDLGSSLLVAEIKRDDQESPEQQAEWNFLPEVPKGTVPKEMLSKIVLSGFPITLERTAIRGVASHFIAMIGGKGDGGDFVQWVCLNGTDSVGGWVLWLESGEIEGGAVGIFQWQRLEAGAVLDQRCRTLHDGGIKLPNHLRLGLTDSDVLKILGSPTVRQGDRFIYVHEHMESIRGEPYTSENILAILFRGRLAQAIDVSKLTSS
jgi:hypothetical protein